MNYPTIALFTLCLVAVSIESRIETKQSCLYSTALLIFNIFLFEAKIVDDFFFTRASLLISNNKSRVLKGHRHAVLVKIQNCSFVSNGH